MKHGDDSLEVIKEMLAQSRSLVNLPSFRFSRPSISPRFTLRRAKTFEQFVIAAPEVEHSARTRRVPVNKLEKAVPVIDFGREPALECVMHIARTSL
jgi:hypothetical protein